MHVGVDSFVSAVTDPATGRVVGPEERMEHLLEEIALADRVGPATPSASASTTARSTTTPRRR